MSRLNKPRIIPVKEIFTYLFLTAGLVAVLFPFVWMLLSAFKTGADVYTYPPKWIPTVWKLDNFAKVFKMVPFARYYFNSFFVTGLITLGQIFVSMLAGYALARLDFPFKNSIFVVILSTMLLPFQVTLIPTFLIINKLEWIDTYQGLIVPFLFAGFSIFFLRQFFLTIPLDLYEAAKIDGCGYFGILFKVILPNARPALGTISLFTYLEFWRSYLWPLIVTNSTRMRTLPIGLNYLMSEGGGEYQLMMAASLLTIVPVLIVYAFAEKQFIKSVVMTGIKN
ncbi:MAG: carbohydrate ABC transporter permease [Spirochaetota bacterium]